MNSVVAVPAAVLAFLGRHGTLVAATSIFIGLCVPPLAAAFKPYLGAAIVVMMVLAFLRVDPAELRSHWVQPRLLALATLWSVLIMPALFIALFLLLGTDRHMPGLYFMLILQMAAPAITSAPALAALLGLDIALTLASVIVSTAAAPLTAVLFTHLFLGTAIEAPLAFGLRLLLIIGGSALAAAVIRHFAGRAWIERQHLRIDGLSVLAMTVFAIAAMDGVTANLLRNPALVAGLVILAFAVSLGSIAITALVFIPAGRARAFAIGLIAGNRNIGVMLATGILVPDVGWLYFALAQMPIYMLPHLLKPLARRIRQSSAG